MITQAARFEHRTSVGSDVHARSVACCALDGQSGEVFERRLGPDPVEMAAWIMSSPTAGECGL